MNPRIATLIECLGLLQASSTRAELRDRLEWELVLARAEQKRAAREAARRHIEPEPCDPAEFRGMA